MKIFDYKFIMILGMTLVIYFIYREVERLTERVNELEQITKGNQFTSIQQSIDEPLQLPLPEHNVVTSQEEFQLPLPQQEEFQLPLPPQEDIINEQKVLSPLPEVEQENVEQNDIEQEYVEQENVEQNDVEQEYVEQYMDNVVELSIPIDVNDGNNMVEESTNLSTPQKSSESPLIEESDDENIVNETIEEYSNNSDDDTKIYSNDNDEDMTSAMESIVELRKDNDNVSNLLKNNKLAELQEMARELDISLVNEETQKKKTKVQLANDIVEKKDN